MISKQNTAVAILVVVLAATMYAFGKTSREGPPRRGRRTSADSAAVDQRSLATVEELVALPTTRSERPLAEDALRIADQEMDLSFADAVRNATTQPRTLSPEARTIAARLQQSRRELLDDEAEVAQLTAALEKATGTKKLELRDELDLAQAHVALHQDEVDDGRQDLIRVGGDPQGRIQAMVAEHEASSRHSDSLRINSVTTIDGSGLVDHAQAWLALRDKRVMLVRAQAQADSEATRFGGSHDSLERQTARDDSAGERGVASDTGAKTSANQVLSHSVTTALLKSTEQRASDNKARAALDQHADNQHKLAETYGRWTTVIDRRQRAVVHRSLQSLGIILAIMLLGLLLDRWIEHVLGGATIDRRRLQTLYMVTRVSIQVVGALFILLVIFGPPNNLGTFIGLAGAGLTVALKDFIVGFIGWFVLMGKDGIRIGDLVEINGVTGEVVELGMFHTVLLETGAWSDAGHPTGRRVTFTNSFAIEGHYFNFSTSGQWLWDDVHVVVPASRDPFPIADAIKKQVEESTAETARAAEQHWKGAAKRSPNLSTLTAAPAINIKPIMGGTEITVRYITHVSQRAELRSKLYHMAVDLIGERKPQSAAIPAPSPPPTVPA